MADSPAHGTAPVSDSVKEAVQSLRARYATLHEQSSLSNRYPLAVSSERVLGCDTICFWFEDGTALGQYIRLVDHPGTLSGDILRLRRDLPPFQGHFELDGDTGQPHRKTGNASRLR